MGMEEREQLNLDWFMLDVKKEEVCVRKTEDKDKEWAGVETAS